MCESRQYSRPHQPVCRAAGEENEVPDSPERAKWVHWELLKATGTKCVKRTDTEMVSCPPE